MQYYKGDTFKDKGKVPSGWIQRLTFKRKHRTRNWGYEYKSLYVAINSKNSKENFIWDESSKANATFQTNVSNDHVLKLQKKEEWILTHCQKAQEHSLPSFPTGSTVKECITYDVIKTLNLVRNQNRRDGSYFTLKYIKEICKKLELKSLASKSKEMLMDEIFEKLLKDAELPDVKRPDELLVVHAQNGRYSNAEDRSKQAGGDTSKLETDYAKTIATVSRIIGEHLYIPNGKSDCDTRTLENIYTLYKMKDPYDGFEDFLKEQELLDN